MAKNKPRFDLLGWIMLWFAVVAALTWLAGVLVRCARPATPSAARAPTPCEVVFTRPTAVAGYQAVPSTVTPGPTQPPTPCPTQVAAGEALPCPTQLPPEIVVQECPACPTPQAPLDPTIEAPEAGQQARQAAPPCDCPEAEQGAPAPARIGARIELQARPVSGPCSRQAEEVWTVVQWQDTVGGWHNVTGWQGWLDAGWRKAWWVDEKDLGTGPFRWALICDCRCQAWAVSPPFHLPAQPGQTLRVDVVLGG